MTLVTRMLLLGAGSTAVHLEWSSFFGLSTFAPGRGTSVTALCSTWPGPATTFKPPASLPAQADLDQCGHVFMYALHVAQGITS